MSFQSGLPRFTVFLTGLSLVACSGGGVQPLRVGVSGDYPPFCRLGGEDEGWQGYRGFDIELLRQMADDLDITVEFKPFRWSQLKDRLTQGDLDMAVCGITQRADRARVMTFSRPYATSRAVVVIRARERERFPTPLSLDRPDFRIAVNQGGHLERVARAHFKAARLHPLANNLRLNELLLRGAVDAVISDRHEAGQWAGVILLGPLSEDLKGWAFGLDQFALRRVSDAWLADHEARGELALLRQRHGLADAGGSPAEWCGRALVAAVERRLSLMPAVATEKRRQGLPISDPAQERRVLTKVRADAHREGLDETAVLKLFRILMERAKWVQQQRLTSPETASGEISGTSLVKLREAVAAASDSLLPEIARCQGVLSGQEAVMSRLLRNRLSDQLDRDQIRALLFALPPRAKFLPAPTEP